MPNIIFNLPEVDKSITRPALISVVKQVMEITGINPATRITYKGESDTVVSDGSALGQTGADPAVLSGAELLTIDVIERFNQDQLGSTATTQVEQIPIFVDDKIGVDVRPVYVAHDFEITVRFRSNSRTEALNWRNMIQMKSAQMRDMNIHRVSYHYLLPVPVINILNHVHELREAVSGYGDTFDTYLYTNATSRLTEITDQGGIKTGVAVAETQNRIVGLFSFQGSVDQITKENDTTWVGEFSYNVTMSIPTGCAIHYPVMVHNQLVDTKYIPEAAPDMDTVDFAQSMSLSALRYFEAGEYSKQYIDTITPHRIPEYDEFVPDNAPPGMMGVFSALCEVDAENPHYILNLADLGDYEIDPELLEYFRNVEYRYLTLPYKSMYHISLYRFKYLTTDRNLYVDKDLNLMSREPLSLRTNHRVRICLHSNVTGVDKEALKRMRRYPTVLDKTLRAIRVDRGQLNAISGQVNLLPYFKDLPDSGVSLQEIRNTHVGMNTVMTSYVMTRKAGVK